MPTTIEALELQVQSNGASAVAGLDALSASLTKLKNATKGGVGLAGVANQIGKLGQAVSALDVSGVGKVGQLVDGLGRLRELEGLKISSSIGNQLGRIGEEATRLNGVDFSGLGRMADGLRPLGELGKATGLRSAITQLERVPELAEALDKVNWDKFERNMQRLAAALGPLAGQANAVRTAFQGMPKNMSGVVAAVNKLSNANNKTNKSYTNLSGMLKSIPALGNSAGKSFLGLAARTGLSYAAIRRVGSALSGLITQSNKYIEDLNLFNVSMGEYAEQAHGYAEQVAEVMGIDPAEWMRNQGIFNTITKGFGVASDRAYTMSKNLTQLTYDLSSFYNISYEDAFQKLQSGISGELEPLRRLGYDLSVARLQQEALNLGIIKSVNAMTQAEKSELRYYAIMTQVTAAQGDMARTLMQPANQLRVLQAQVTQTSRAFGNLFLPTLSAVLPYAIAVAKALRLVAVAIASLLHIPMPSVDFGDFSAGAGAVGGLADSADDAAGALGGAADKAKELKRTLLGIDELNVLPDQSTQGGGGSGGLAGLDGLGGLGFELPEYDFLGDALDDRIAELLAPMEKLIDEMKRDIENGDWWSAGAALAGALNGVFDSVNYEALGRKLGLGIEHALTFGLGFVYTFDWEGRGANLAEALNGLTDGLDPTIFGAALGAKLRIGIEFAYGFVTTFKWEKFGAWLGEALNGWAREIDEVKLAKTINEGIRGALRMVSSFFEKADFEEIGRKIGRFLATLDWEGIFTDAFGAVGDILGGLKGALAGVFEEADFSDIAEAVGAILAIKFAPKLLGALLHPFKTLEGLAGLKDKLTGGGAGEALVALNTSVTDIGNKLKELAKNLAWGLVILTEVAAGALIFAGAVVLLGKELEQVGIAWQPVLDNGPTVIAGLGLGATVLLDVGVATYALGTAGGTLAANIGIGTAILAELGLATGLFLVEIWAVGKGLDEIGQAWQPVLENGETIKTAILTGTGLLVGVGVVTAALGTATVASAGTLPVAIGLGTALLVELSAATVLFTESLVAVADEMTDNLAPALENFNAVLPGLSDNMANFTSYMGTFAGHVVEYSKNDMVSSIAATVDTVVGWFTADPFQKLADDVNDTYEQTKGLNEKLNLAVPELATATGLLTNYATFCGMIASITESADGSVISGAIFIDMKDAGAKVILGFTEGITENAGQVTAAMDAVRLAVDNGLLTVQESSRTQWGVTELETLGAVERIGTGVGTGYTNMGTAVATTLGNAQLANQAAWLGMETDSLDASGRILAQVPADFGNVNTQVTGSVQSMRSSVAGEMDSLVGSAWSWGSDLASNIASGISSGISAVASAASSLAEKIRGFLHFSVPDVGPLRDFDTYMPDMLREMAGGIRGNEDVVVREVDDLAANIAASMQDALTAAGNYSAIGTMPAVRAAVPSVAGRGNEEFIEYGAEDMMSDMSVSARAAGAAGGREEIQLLRQILDAVRRGQSISIGGREILRVVQDQEQREAIRTGSVYVG